MSFGIQFSNFGYIVWLGNQILFGETDDICCCEEEPPPPPQCWCGGCIEGIQPDTVTVSLEGIGELDNECMECLDLNGTYVLTKCNTSPDCPYDLLEGCPDGLGWTCYNLAYQFENCMWSYAGEATICEKTHVFRVTLVFASVPYYGGDPVLALKITIFGLIYVDELIWYGHCTPPIDCASLGSVNLDHWQMCGNWNYFYPAWCGLSDPEHLAFTILG